MTTLDFLQQRLNKELQAQSHYQSKDGLFPWEEVVLEQTIDAVSFYKNAISTIQAFNTIVAA